LLRCRAVDAARLPGDFRGLRSLLLQVPRGGTADSAEQARKDGQGNENPIDDAESAQQLVHGGLPPRKTARECATAPCPRGRLILEPQAPTGSLEKMPDRASFLRRRH